MKVFAVNSNKNAVIELLRFYYASSILIFHISRMDLNLSSKTLFVLGPWKANFFRMGNLGVEFFFVISGYLMASSVYRKISVTDKSQISIGEETAAFIFKKVKRLYPHYFFACLLMSVILLLEGSKISSMIKRLPSLLFLQKTGISEETFLRVTWFISSMLIAMAVIYPFLKKYYYTFTALIAPLGGILIVGFLMKNYGNLQNSFTWMGFTYKCNFRALAEIAMGTTCFEIGRRIKDLELTRRTRILLSAASIGFVLLTLICMCSGAAEYGGLFLLIICFIVTVSFSRTGFWGDCAPLYGSRLFIYLGSLSVSMFFYQDLFRNLVPRIFDGAPKKVLAILIYAGTVLFSMLANFLMDKIRSMIKAPHNP